MDKKIFLKRFDEAIDSVLNKARKALIEDVPNECKFIIGYVDFRKTDPISKNEAIDIMYRDKKVPRWVDISLKTIDNDISLITCDLAPDYFENDEELLYEEEGVAPFRVGYPNLPESYKEGKKYSVKDLRRE